MGLEIRQRGVLEIIDTAFRIYRKYFLKLLAINVVVYVPYALTLVLAMPPLIAKAAASAIYVHDAKTAVLQMLVAALPVVLGSLFFQQIATGAITAAVSEIYLDRQPSVGRAYRAVFSRLLPFLGAVLIALLVVVLLAFGSSVFVGFIGGAFSPKVAVVLSVIGGLVPGVVFLLWFSLVPCAAVIEHTGAFGSLARSQRLVRGYLAKSFGLFFLIGLLLWLLGQGADLVINRLIADPRRIFSVAEIQRWVLISITAKVVIETLIRPIWGIVTVLLYYDLRIRKEGFDIEAMLN